MIVQIAFRTIAKWRSETIANLAPLTELRSNGVMPKDGLIWLGLGFRPPKRNALEIDPDCLPTDSECKCVAGLDVVLFIRGYMTKYGILRRLCGSLLASRPHRLQVIDLDYKRIAYLKLGGY
ncbi:hypothetical protein EGT07_10225 [Herbaspirillum sp. HC18]|nr:hypothetical protein EGT07_10225 [Herbaspirillum sp. HC18]